MTHDVSVKQLRVFGIGFFFILGALGAFLLWKGSPVIGPVLVALSAPFGILGAFFPRALKPVYGPWMVFAEKLAWFNTRLILALVYFLVITPMGLLMRLFGKDPMHRKEKSDSFWKESAVREHDHFERQF